MIARLIMMFAVLFAVFYGFLALCFTKGYLTFDRLKKWSKAAALCFLTLVLVVVTVGMFAGLDKLL